MSRTPRYLIWAEGIALLIVVIAVWLGAHEFVGTFGRMGEAKSCGSVWGLIGTGDLNAATCRDDLRDRLALVAGLIGFAAAVALIAPLILRRSSTDSSPRRRLGVFLALAVSIVISVVMIAVGRHLIWSVSGA